MVICVMHGYDHAYEQPSGAAENLPFQAGLMDTDRLQRDASPRLL